MYARYGVWRAFRGCDQWRQFDFVSEFVELIDGIVAIVRKHMAIVSKHMADSLSAQAALVGGKS